MKLAEVQELIESSKFEPGARNLDALQKATGEAQIVSLLLLSAARHPGTPAVDSGLAEALEAEAARLTRDREPSAPDLHDALARLTRQSAAPLAAVPA